MKLFEVARKPKATAEFKRLSLAEIMEKFNKPSAHDWFYDYFLTHVLGGKLPGAYKRWRAKNPDVATKVFVELKKNEEEKDPLLSSDFSDFADIERGVQEDGDRVNFYSTLDMSDFKGKLESVKPPFKLGYVTEFIAKENGLSEYPDWFPRSCDRLILSKNNFKSLHSFDKQVIQCMDLNLEDNPCESHLLSLLKIKRLTRLRPPFIKATGKDRKDFKMIEKYIKKNNGTPNNVSLLDCQSEMLDAGYDEQAQV